MEIPRQRENNAVLTGVLSFQKPQVRSQTVFIENGEIAQRGVINQHGQHHKQIKYGGRNPAQLLPSIPISSRNTKQIRPYISPSAAAK